MSIIHDALKKVQQDLASKAGETPVSPTEKNQQASAYIFEAPPRVETIPVEQLTVQTPPVQNKIKSILALICASAITAGSVWYIYQQFQENIPQIQRLAKKSFYSLIHKQEQPDFKAKAPADLTPLAQLTINSTQATVPVTLNIHGIMSNASGNLALINDQVYQEGDEIDGAKIVKINLNSITVLINGAEKTIHVKN